MRIIAPRTTHATSDNANITLSWNNSFAQDRTQQFNRMQAYIDSEVIRLMIPYTPMLNGILYKSATLGTTIRSGVIKQTTPYARYQYYGRLMVSRINGSSYATQGESKVLTNTPLHYNTFRHPQSGPMWFERMKTDKKDSILRGVRRYLR